jgi:hypothetical protein
MGIVPAHDLFYTLYPSELIRSRLFIQQHIHPFLWDPVVISFLRMPAWLILGIPGGILLWRFRPHQGRIEEADDLPYSTYEEVLASALEGAEQGEAEQEGDEQPSKYQDLADFDPTRTQPGQGSAAEVERIELKNP